jgi:3-oxoadipyl-CoA thiolase
VLDAWIYDGLRTPFGRHAGALAPVRADDLVAGVMRALLARSPWRPEALEDVLVGCTNQAGEDSRNVARHAALLAGFPPSVPAQTVNRLCASGLAAVVDAARAITVGEGELYLAGGVESMSRAPFAMAKAEGAYARDVRVFDTTLGARFPNPRLASAYGSDTMPETGDNVAREQGISRAEADRFAARSQERAERARATGFLDGEIVPVEVPGPGKGTAVVRVDEHPRPATTVEALARLSPLFPGGVVTAGNASGVNDGAAALLVGSRAAGERAGVRPLARILSSAAVGVEPRVMGIGPALAIPKALARAGLGLDRMDVIEVNEAFASQVLACLKILGLPIDDGRVNPNGGAIALGHPLGASGARLALTAARELRRRGGGRAVVSLCIGVGQGLAMVMEAA